MPFITSAIVAKKLIKPNTAAQIAKISIYNSPISLIIFNIFICSTKTLILSTIIVKAHKALESFYFKIAIAP